MNKWMKELTNKFILLIILVPFGKKPLGKEHLKLSSLRNVRVQISFECFSPPAPPQKIYLFI